MAARGTGARLGLSGLCIGLATVLAALIGGCGSDRSPSASLRGASTGMARPFEMGFSSVPPQPTDESYRSSFRFAASAGEVILIQRAPPWSEFLPGGVISDRTANLTRLEREEARSQGLKLFLAIDPTDPADRGRLANLPDELRGRDFSDVRVRAAFIAYAKYLALNYKPAYLALGVEVNMFFNRRGDAAFRNFQSMYFEAYDAVKAVSAGTLVFPTFQYEDLLAVLNTGEATQPGWSLIGRFEPKIDMVAVSTYPGFAFASLSRVPADYFAPLKQRSTKPIAITSAGWTSAAETGASAAAEGDQAGFLGRALSEAEDDGISLFVWYLGRDLAITPAAGFDPLAMTGLFGADGQPKAAWRVWRAYSDRPAAARP